MTSDVLASTKSLLLCFLLNFYFAPDPTSHPSQSILGGNAFGDRFPASSGRGRESSSLALVEKPSPNCLPQSPKAFQMSQWWQMRNLCSDIFFLLFMRKVLFPIGPGSMLNGCIVYILYIYFEWHTDSVTVFQFEYEKPGIKRIVVRLQIRHNIFRFLKLYLILTNLLGEPLVFCLLILGIWTLLNTGCFFSLVPPLKVPSTKKLI